MIAAPIADPQARLRRWLDGAADTALLVLLCLRPLVWSGDPADPGNVAFDLVAAIAILIGALRLVLGAPVAWSWATMLAAVFLGWAAVGAWRSPVPAAAWSLVAMWMLHLGAALALASRVRERHDLLVAGILASIASQGLVLLAQIGWERPAIQAEIAADPTLIDQEHLRAAYVDRAHTWRLEGSFLLANTLAAWVILALPIAFGALVAGWHHLRTRWLLVVITAIGVFTLVRSGSKMGMLALVLAVVVAGWQAGGRWRRGFVLAAVLVIGGALALPQLRERVVASAEARIGYWQGAATLITERPLLGHGGDAFRVEYPRVKPPAAEETIYVHSEPLQAAVDLGLIGAALLLGWWLLGLRAAFRDDAPLGLHPNPSRVLPALLCGAIMAYVFLIGGVLGGRSLTSAQSITLGAALVLLSVIMVAWIPTPRLPRWCLPTAVLACGLHALADFHFHSPQVVGVLALLAVAATPGRWQWCPHRTVAKVAVVSVGLLVGVLTITATLWAVPRQDLRERATLAMNVLAHLRIERDHPAQAGHPGDTNVGLLAALAAFPEAGFAGPQALADAAVTALATDALRWPAEHEQARLAARIALLATDLAPSQAVRFHAALKDLQQQFASDPALAAALSELSTRLATQDSEWIAEALTWTRAAVARYPVHLPLRRRLARLAEQAGHPEEAAAQRAIIAELSPVVHPTNR